MANASRNLTEAWGRRPEWAPPTSARASGTVPVRFDGRPDFGPFAGVTRWAGVREFTHDHLCRVFRLDPALTYFDLPSTIRGVGAASVGALSGDGRRRVINGYVCYGRYPEPVGKLTVVLDEKTGLRDDDPTNARDFLDLSRT